VNETLVQDKERTKHKDNTNKKITELLEKQARFQIPCQSVSHGGVLAREKKAASQSSQTRPKKKKEWGLPEAEATLTFYPRANQYSTRHEKRSHSTLPFLRNVRQKGKERLKQSPEADKLTG